ncbi:MAG: LamG domain-containing protein [Verrucomicrobiota bacterium]
MQPSVANPAEVHPVVGGKGFTFQLDGFPEAAGAFTVEAYVREESRGNGTAGIVSMWGSPHLSIHFGITSDGSLKSYFSQDGSAYDLVDSGIDLALDVDYFVAMTYDEGDLVFYVRDLDAGTWTTASAITYSSLHGFSYLRIGNDQSGNHSFDGEIDEVRISKGALPQSWLLASLPEDFVLDIGDIAIESLSATDDVVITWATHGSFSYALEEKSDLVVDPWGTNTTRSGTSGDVSVTNSTLGQSSSFYRVTAEQK